MSAGDCIGRQTVMRSLCLFALIAGRQQVLAEEPPVPLYSPEEALRLSYEPISRMVDDTTCERIEGVRLKNKNLYGAGGLTALYRMNSPKKPFRVTVTREDSVFVVRFPAKPNEVIVAKSISVAPGSNKVWYGKPTYSTCMVGTVQVGDLQKLNDEEVESKSQVPEPP